MKSLLITFVAAANAETCAQVTPGWDCLHNFPKTFHFEHLFHIGPGGTHCTAATMPPPCPLFGFSSSSQYVLLKQYDSFQNTWHCKLSSLKALLSAPKCIEPRAFTAEHTPRLWLCAYNPLGFVAFFLVIFQSNCSIF